MAKRLAWLDYAKYICIMAVMIEHLESTTDELLCFFSPFVVLTFFVVAGYTHRPGQPFRGFMWKKIKTLFVPWLVFSVFDIVVSQFVSFSEHESIWVELGRNFLQVRGYGDQLWFVAALFMAFIPFWCFVELYSRKKATPSRRTLFIIIALLLFVADSEYSKRMNPSLFPWGTSALPWHLEYIFQGMFYMTLGYMFRESWEPGFDRLNTHLGRLVLSAVYLLIIYLPYFVTIPESIFGISAVYVTPIIGIAVVFAFSKVIPENKYMSYVGQNTLICFAFHGKIYSFIQVMLRRFAATFYAAVLSNDLYANLFAIAFTFVLSVILIIPAYIINRWFPFVLGRKHKAKPQRA